MATMSGAIPVVDFAEASLALDTKDVADNVWQTLATQICHAFTTVGFVYLKNIGITEKELQNFRDVGGRFFALPPEVKGKYPRGETNHGWVCLERESLNPERGGDLKEAYNMTPQVAKVWPEAEVPGFKEAFLQFFARCTELSDRILYATALGLKLEDPMFFKKCHNTNIGHTTLRYLYYPKLKGIPVNPGQIRCGEHSDYGSITILFQDQVGGLQVMTRDGEYIDATPIPGTVVVNIGDCLQRWTADKLKSTKHRVLVPEREGGSEEARVSVAFFVHPDDECLIECLDGSNKYPPITSRDHLKERFSATY